MLAATFTLTNCAKEIEGSVQEPESVGYPFEIVASTVDTKTANDGMSTKWVEGDQINVFHALGESTEYVNDGAFTVSDVEAGVFTGTIEEVLDVEEEYDWYVLYPYNEKVATPGAKEAGFTYIGYSTGLNQTGYNSMASLKGSVCPLYGTAKYAGVRPEITMNHLSSIIEIKVTNENEEPLTITTASFTATEDIVGSYYIDITKEPVVYTPSNAKYVKTEAIVNVSGGTALAQGESAILYAAIKPFTAPSGQKLTLSVNGYSKEIELSQDVIFTAGKIKTLTFGYDKPETPVEPAPEGVKTATISFASTAQRTSFSTSEQVWENEDVVFINSKGSSTNNVADYYNPARFYKSSNISITAPGNITKVEFNSSTGDYLTNLQNSLTGDSTNGNSVVMELDGSSNSVTYTLSGGQVRLNTLTVTYVIADPSAPSITAGNVTGVSARGVESAELTYDIDNLEYSDLTVTCDGTVVTSASKGADGVINYVVSANATTSARDGSIAISNGTVTRNVKVSQLAPVFTVSRNAVELGATADSQTTVTVTSDFDWTLSSEGTGYTVTPDSYTWDEDGKETVAIQATASRTEEGVAELGTITLVNSTTGQKLTIDVTQATSYVSQDAVTVTMNIFANKGTTGTKSISWTQEGFTVTNKQASSTSTIRTSDSDHFRLYAKSELIFTSSSKTFEKVVVTCTSSSYASVLETSAKNAGLTATVSGNDVTISTSSPTTAMPTITMSAQSRIKKVVVELK